MIEGQPHPELDAIRARVQAHTLEQANRHNSLSTAEKEAKRGTVVFHKDWGTASTMTDDDWRDGLVLALYLVVERCAAEGSQTARVALADPAGLGAFVGGATS